MVPPTRRPSYAPTAGDIKTIKEYLTCFNKAGCRVSMPAPQFSSPLLFRLNTDEIILSPSEMDNCLGFRFEPTLRKKNFKFPYICVPVDTQVRETHIRIENEPLLIIYKTFKDMDSPRSGANEPGRFLSVDNRHIYGTGAILII